MRKVCCAKWDEVTGEWKKLQNEELYSVYSSPFHWPIIRECCYRSLHIVGSYETSLIGYMRVAS